MIEDAERSGNSHDPKNGESGIQEISATSAHQHAENRGANSADKKDRRRQRHAHKQFDLMMEQAAVVQDADTRDARRSYKDAHNLRAPRPVESQHHCDYHGAAPPEADKKPHRPALTL